MGYRLLSRVSGVRIPLRRLWNDLLIPVLPITRAERQGLSFGTVCYTKWVRVPQSYLFPCLPLALFFHASKHTFHGRLTAKALPLMLRFLKMLPFKLPSFSFA